jgi:hypothetical protein
MEGCRVWNETVCVGCSGKYFMNYDNNTCHPIDTNCRIWGPIGNCIECYPLYKNSFFGCVPVDRQSELNNHSSCGSMCGNCLDSAYLNSKGMC